MTQAGSPRLQGYAAIAAVALIGALAVRRPEFALLAAPFALLLVVGTRSASDPEVSVRLLVDTDRTLEGEELDATLAVRAARPVDRLELLLELPPGMEAVGDRPARAVRLDANEDHEIPVTLRCTRWGVFDLGRVQIRARDPFRVVVWSAQAESRHRIKAYPRELSLRRVLAPLQTQAFAGSEVSRVKGEGVEYADLREFVPGDRVRTINWRASARRQSLVVNERHPERNTDVVLFIDTFAEARTGAGSTLDLAVRATATLAARYIRRRDRVGLVSFGGVLRWLQPGSGLTQLYRIAEALIDTELVLNYAWKEIDIVPRRTLPPQALVIAVTPLLDERSVGALLDLRARGFDLAIVETSPVPYAEPGTAPEEQIAFRIWRLRRDALRARYQRAGVAVVEWREELPLASALEEVTRFRRYAVRGRG